MQWMPQKVEQLVLCCAGSLLLLFGSTLMTSCAEPQASADSAVADTVAQPSQSLVVERGDLTQVHVITGELDSNKSSPIIVPAVPSWNIAIRWMIEDGSYVKAGQKILEFDNSQFTQPFEQAQALEIQKIHELERKRADTAVQLGDLEFALNSAQVAYDKAAMQADLPEELVPKRDYEEKQLALERAKIALEKASEALAAAKKSTQAELKILEIELASARREMQAAEQAMEKLVIHAPVDGILVVSENRRENRKYQVGDSANRGRQIMKIPDLNEVIVRAWLADVDDGLMVPGETALCTLDSYPDRVFKGVVRDISPIAVPMQWQSDRRAFKVTIDLLESDPELMRPGMSVRVAVQRPMLKDQWLAPRQALRFEEDQTLLQTESEAISVEVVGCNAMRCAVDSEQLSEGLRLEGSL